MFAERITEAAWRRLSRHSRLIIWVMLEGMLLQRQIETLGERFTRILRGVPVKMAGMQAGMCFGLLAVSPEGAPAVWMALCWVLSLYGAALVCAVANRRRPAYGR